MAFSLEYRPYEVAFRLPVRTAHGPWAKRSGVYLRSVDETGRVRLAEVCPVPQFGLETLEDDKDVLAALGDSVDGEAASRVPEELGSLRGALAAVLGAEPPAPAREDLSLAALLPQGRAAFEVAAARAEAGFRVFKWKVGVGDERDEMAMLDDLLGVLPAGSRVRLDANGGWDTRAASRWLAQASERPVEFVEQPLDPGLQGFDDRILGLAADYPATIALDESVCSDADVTRWMSMGWKGIYVVKPSLLGDPQSTLAALSGGGHRVVFSSALETAIGACRALRWALSWSGPRLAAGFGVWPLFESTLHDGPSAAPFLRAAEIERPNLEALWNAAA